MKEKFLEKFSLNHFPRKLNSPRFKKYILNLPRKVFVSF